MALFVSLPAVANDPDDYMYVNPDFVELNDEGVGTVTVWLKTYVEEYLTFGMDLYLPEGFTIVKNSRGKYIFTWNDDDITGSVVSHQMSYADRDGFIRIIATSMSQDYILPGDNWLFSFQVQAPEGFNSQAEAEIKNIGFAEGLKEQHNFDDVTFTIGVKTTGVENISCEGDGEEVIYNLQGIRMERPLRPGIYIINGVKTAVR